VGTREFIGFSCVGVESGAEFVDVNAELGMARFVSGFVLGFGVPRNKKAQLALRPW
jgi:hypothetical protein